MEPFDERNLDPALLNVTDFPTQNSSSSDPGQHHTGDTSAQNGGLCSN
jgi:hypothetical protein